MRCKVVLILLVIWLLPASVFSQDNAIQIGIDEKLGNVVPKDLSFYDEDGNKVVLGELLGEKPTVLSLVFYLCEGICTPLLNGLAEGITRMTQLSLGKDYQIITISFDPTETPELARNKRANYMRMISRAETDKSWRFLTGNKENIDKICDAVGFRYIEQGGTFVHSGALTILSPEGKIVRYIYGSNISRNVMPVLPLELQLALTEAAGGKIGPTINKVLQLCFQYDQEGKRYVLSVTRIAMAVVVIFALLVLLYVTAFSRISRESVEKRFPK